MVSPVKASLSDFPSASPLREMTAGLFAQIGLRQYLIPLPNDGTGVTLRAPTELGVPWPCPRHLTAARIGHGDFALYHGRLDHQVESRLCTVRQRTHRQHVCYCLNIPPPLRFYGPHAGAVIARALGSRGYKKFIGLVEQPSFFETVCQRNDGLLFSPYAH